MSSKAMNRTLGRFAAMDEWARTNDENSRRSFMGWDYDG
jgi:hypothetical protein